MMKKSCHKNEKNAKRGAKCKYTNDMHERIIAFARDGLTDKEMCQKLGISQSTFYSWQRQYPKLQKILKKTKEVVDETVVAALYKRCIGFTYNEIHDIESPEGKTKKVIKKMVVPDPTACFFWLKNRQPDKWREKIAEYKGDGCMQELADALERSLDKK